MENSLLPGSARGKYYFGDQRAYFAGNLGSARVEQGEAFIGHAGDALELTAINGGQVQGILGVGVNQCLVARHVSAAQVLIGEVAVRYAFAGTIAVEQFREHSRCGVNIVPINRAQ